MRTDDPAYIQGALGLIEDAMAEMNNAWAEASGLCADFDLWRRMEYLKIREEIKDSGRWVKGTTETEGICELQKVYFRPSLRGLGFGRKILERCIQEAAMAGYRLMYLESVPQMSNAVGIYEKLGFQHLSTRRGT